jgi:hypothetical protein
MANADEASQGGSAEDAPSLEPQMHRLEGLDQCAVADRAGVSERGAT